MNYYRNDNIRMSVLMYCKSVIGRWTTLAAALTDQYQTFDSTFPEVKAARSCYVIIFFIIWIQILNSKSVSIL